MSPSHRLHNQPAWVLALAVSGAVFVVLLALDLIDDVLLDTDGGAGDFRILELDDERNLPNWVGTLQFAAAAVPWMVLAWLERRRAWLALAGLMLVLSFEEEAGIHDTIERELGADLSRMTWEPALAVVIVIGFFLLRRRLEPDSRRLLTFGMAALLIGQAASTINGEGEGPRIVSGFLYRAEEGGELLTGAFVMAAGIAAVEARTGVREAWSRLRASRSPRTRDS